MIIFLAPGGRLGNLLFQVSYLESIRRPDERILTMNLFGVHRSFPGLRKYYNTDFRPLTRFIDKFVLPWLGTFLELSRLATIHREHDGILRKRTGLLPFTFVEGYFQGPAAVKKTFRFAAAPMTVAQSTVSLAKDRCAVFVHVRRGDYERYVVEDSVRPLLGEDYYRSAIRSLQALGKPLHFFFLGDSPEWCRQTFSDIEPKSVSALAPLEDLALMSLCEGGVVSNSTFAWWGGFFCPRTLPVFGPRYWLGWTVGRWIPRNIETPWMTYLENPKEQS